jgi:hypothetical protein
MANMDKNADYNSITKFLVFVDNDMSCSLSRVWKEHIEVVRFFLDNNQFAMNIYKQYIKTSPNKFPTFNHMVSIIAEINERTGTFEDKAYFFCFDLWMYIYH